MMILAGLVIYPNIGQNAASARCRQQSGLLLVNSTSCKSEIIELCEFADYLI